MLASTELINAYNMTATQRATWLDLLRKQGISHFIYRLNSMNEWSSGNSSGVAPAQSMIADALALGIEVSIDLHTWYTTWDNYFRDSASNAVTNRQNYLNYVTNVINAFQSTPVFSFMVLNEPQARTASAAENNFIRSCISTAKTVTAKPISVRFMCGYSPSTGHYSSQIDVDSDYICRNFYWDARNPTVEVYGCTEAKLLAALSTAHSQGKEFWATEFGDNGTLSEKTSYVKANVDYGRLKGFDRMFCWASQLGSGEAYNILAGDGTVTPLGGVDGGGPFYQLTNESLPQPIQSHFGVSGRPSTWGSDTDYQTSIVQEVIDFLNLKGLSVYRMCFFIGTSEATIRNCVQYYLEHCNHKLILNYYHNASATVNWADSTALALSLLNYFSAYQDRIILEPYNQYAQSFTEIQTFVNTIRNAGYTSKIYCSRWYTQNQQDFINIVDPIYGHIVCGQQQYLNTIGLTGAISRTQVFLDAGVEVIDGEVGAHVSEYPQFTQALVDDVNSYLAWASENGVSACVWMLQGMRNYYVASATSYESLALTYPASTPPPPPQITLPFHDDLTTLNNLKVEKGNWSVV